jgi:catechol 2,3-dioxygenase-like lactoylglutathione lyase family enzyme
MLLGALCAGAGATLLGWHAHAQARALPLKNPGLEHLDIVVPDTAESARFYKRVFSSPLHEQDFRGGKRYFVLLGDLPPDRQVGYIAIGAANGRPIGVGITARSPNRRTSRRSAKSSRAGYPEPAGLRPDPDTDGLELQLLTAGRARDRSRAVLARRCRRRGVRPAQAEYDARRQRSTACPVSAVYGEASSARCPVPERVVQPRSQYANGIGPSREERRRISCGSVSSRRSTAAVAPVLRAAGAECSGDAVMINLRQLRHRAGGHRGLGRGDVAVARGNAPWMAWCV